MAISSVTLLPNAGMCFFHPATHTECCRASSVAPGEGLYNGEPGGQGPCPHRAYRLAEGEIKAK